MYLHVWQIAAIFGLLCLAVILWDMDQARLKRKIRELESRIKDLEAQPPNDAE